MANPDTNEIASELNLNTILDSAIIAFRRAVLPLRMFSTVFGNVALNGTNKVEIPYYPIQGLASKDFNGTYDFSSGAGSKIDKREITINKRKYQPISATSSEIARYPRLNLEQLGTLKGQKLGFDVIQDVLSLVTAANYGTAVFTGAANTFDSDDIVDIRTNVSKGLTGPTSVTDGATTNTSTTVTSATAKFGDNDLGSAISGTGIPTGSTIVAVGSATSVTISAAATATATGLTLTLGRNMLPWPETGRSLTVNPDFEGNLYKDSAIKSALASGSDSVIREGSFPRVFGFDFAASAAIPGNGENLVGMAAYMSAMLVGMAPIAPASQKTIDYRVVVDPDTGIAFEYREWFDENTDTLKRVIEANYGYAVGEKFALKRLVSA